MMFRYVACMVILTGCGGGGAGASASAGDASDDALPAAGDAIGGSRVPGNAIEAGEPSPPDTRPGPGDADRLSGDGPADGGATADVGTPPPPDASIPPTASASFAPMNLLIPGKAEAQMRFALTNTGTARLQVKVVLSEDPFFPIEQNDPAGFRILLTASDPNQCSQGSFLAPGSSCNVDVYYVPAGQRPQRTIRVSLVGGQLPPKEPAIASAAITASAS